MDNITEYSCFSNLPLDQKGNQESMLSPLKPTPSSTISETSEPNSISVDDFISQNKALYEELEKEHKKKIDQLQSLIEQSTDVYKWLQDYSTLMNFPHEPWIFDTISDTTASTTEPWPPLSSLNGAETKPEFNGSDATPSFNGSDATPAFSNSDSSIPSVLSEQTLSYLKGENTGFNINDFLQHFKEVDEELKEKYDKNNKKDKKETKASDTVGTIDKTTTLQSLTVIPEKLNKAEPGCEYLRQRYYTGKDSLGNPVIKMGQQVCVGQKGEPEVWCKGDKTKCTACYGGCWVTKEEKEKAEEKTSTPNTKKQDYKNSAQALYEDNQNKLQSLRERRNNFNTVPTTVVGKMSVADFICTMKNSTLSVVVEMPRVADVISSSSKDMFKKSKFDKPEIYIPSRFEKYNIQARLRTQSISKWKFTIKMLKNRFGTNTDITPNHLVRSPEANLPVFAAFHPDVWNDPELKIYHFLLNCCYVKSWTINCNVVACETANCADKGNATMEFINTIYVSTLPFTELEQRAYEKSLTARWDKEKELKSSSSPNGTNVTTTEKLTDTDNGKSN